MCIARLVGLKPWRKRWDQDQGFLIAWTRNWLIRFDRPEVLAYQSKRSCWQSKGSALWRSCTQIRFQKMVSVSSNSQAGRRLSRWQEKASRIEERRQGKRKTFLKVSVLPQSQNSILILECFNSRFPRFPKLRFLIEIKSPWVWQTVMHPPSMRRIKISSKILLIIPLTSRGFVPSIWQPQWQLSRTSATLCDPI